jgi:WRKY transcription factor 22
LIYRGYYRCSRLKGCLAKKQVEKNKSNPTMFIVTYMDEHSHPAPTHRNSLVGSTKQKPLSPQIVTAEDSSTVTTRGDMVSALLNLAREFL